MKLVNGFNTIEDKAKTDFNYTIEGIKLIAKIARWQAQ
jgi:hypothetical protein